MPERKDVQNIADENCRSWRAKSKRVPLRFIICNIPEVSRTAKQAPFRLSAGGPIFYFAAPAPKVVLTAQSGDPVARLRWPGSVVLSAPRRRRLRCRGAGSRLRVSRLQDAIREGGRRLFGRELFLELAKLRLELFWFRLRRFVLLDNATLDRDDLCVVFA
jgi:hypothetical protein